MTGWPEPTERPDGDARAALWRAAVPDIAADELTALDALLHGQPHNLHRLVAAYRAGMARGHAAAVAAQPLAVDVVMSRDPAEPDPLGITPDERERVAPVLTRWPREAWPWRAHAANLAVLAYRLGLGERP